MTTGDEPGAVALDPRPGRLVLVTGADAGQCAALGVALARRLVEGVVVDGAAIEALVRLDPVEPWRGRPTSAQLRARLLRWSAALAVAEIHQLEGHDAVLVEDATGDRLEDLLDLVSPEPVHVVVVRDGVDPSTPHWGLWVDGNRPTDDLADDVLGRLDEARVDTTEPA